MRGMLTIMTRSYSSTRRRLLSTRLPSVSCRMRWIRRRRAGQRSLLRTDCQPSKTPTASTSFVRAASQRLVHTTNCWRSAGRTQSTSRSKLCPKRSERSGRSPSASALPRDSPHVAASFLFIDPQHLPLPCPAVQLEHIPNSLHRKLYLPLLSYRSTLIVIILRRYWINCTCTTITRRIQ